jgi:DNA-binding LacI/PurR family transcriptional regulator
MDTTLKDVAREAGVNLSTASRSLNDAYGVHPKAREHVLAVARQLNYRPDRVARGLVTGRSQTMAVIVSDIRNPFFAEVAHIESLVLCGLIGMSTQASSRVRIVVVAYP